jgi:hypothetical protein
MNLIDSLKRYTKVLKELQKKFGFTPEAVLTAARDQLAKGPRRG